MRLSTVAATCMLITGCIPPSTSLVYDVGLREVQRPAAAQQRYGDQAITQVKDSAGRYRFEDKLIAAHVTSSSVTNNTARMRPRS